MTENNVKPIPDLQEIETKARIWLLRLEDGDMSADEMSEFESWRRESTLHEESFQRIAGFWEGIDFLDKYDDYAESDAAVRSLKPGRFDFIMPVSRQMVVNAMAACLVLFIGVVGYNLIAVDRPFNGLYETAIGAQENIALPDSSQIVLNTNSTIHVDYEKDSRTITLIKGEAYFDVASNKQRPFSVKTKKGVVTAIGTAFSVRLQDEKLNVTVEEGLVALGRVKKPKELTREGGDTVTNPIEPETLMEVSAGQAVIIDSGIEKISDVAQSDLERALDWRDGELAFDGETLEEVISILTRYTDLKVEITDKDLKQQKVVAYYKIGEIDRLFQALEVMANVEVVRIGDDQVKLHRSR